MWSDSAKALAAQGYRVNALVHDWEEDGNKLIKTKLPASIVAGTYREKPTITDRVIRRFFPGNMQSAMHSLYARRIKSARPDLVCVSSGNAIGCLDWMKACVLAKTPYVIIVQAQSESWWPSDQQAKELIELYKKALRVYFVSTQNQELVETQLGYNFRNAVQWSNHSDGLEFRQVEWPDNGQNFKLACIGRLEPSAKGQDLIIRVLALPKWKARPIKISLYGSGDQKEVLLRLVKLYGVEEKVKIAGFSDSIRDIWKSHHAAIFPSRYEGLPLAMTEAMACGRMVVATDVAGHRQLVVDGITGFLADSPTKSHLDEALERAWQARAQWRVHGVNALNHVRKVVMPHPGSLLAEELKYLAKSSQDVDK